MGGTMGKVGGGFSKLFSNSSDVVKGTGQTVKDLKKIGYSDQDIATMGGGRPGAGVGFARGIARGTLSSAPTAAPPQQAAYPPVQFNSGPQPMFDTGGYMGAANPYLNPSAFYGG